MKKIKDSKGAATLFVLIAGLFFISFILSVLMLASAKRQSQIQIGKHTQEIYDELNQDQINNLKNVVPIYTVEQLLKIGSGEEIAIEKENGKKYVFSENAYYILNSDLELEYNGVLDLSDYNFDKSGHTIKVKDISKTETVYYYYTNKYNYPVTENGFKYDGLVLQYDGNNNTGSGHSDNIQVWKDLTGNGNNGTLTNFSYDYTSGWQNESLQFDGNDDGVLIGDSLQELFKNSNTIEFKIKFDDINARDVLIGNYNISNNINYEKNADNSLRQYINAGAMDVASSPLITSNEKEYIISYVFDKANGNLFVYIDGELKYSIDNQILNSYNYSWTNVWIGRDTRTGATCFKGKIYSVRVYNSILTEQEVKNNYEAEMSNKSVIYIPVDKIELNNTELEITVTQGEKLVSTLTPANASNRIVLWESSNTSVATVDVYGEITTIKVGTTVITATTQDGGKTASCTVKVVKDLPAGWESSKVAAVLEEGTRKAPIPVGYTASQISTEDEISEGLVIYQTTTAITGEPNSNAHITAMEGINQYVWIPVDDINDMVMCKRNGTAGTGGSTCNLVYDVTSNQITCQTHGYTTATALTDATIDTTGLAGRLYGTSSSGSGGIYTTSMDFTTTSQTFSANSGYREPDIVKGSREPSYDGAESNLTGIGDGTVATFKAQLNKDFIAMAKSVAKYGGFYVSRYEAGANGASLKNQKVLVAGTSTATNHNPDTYINGNKWYGMYNTLMSSTAIDKTAVNSHMIWGCQYDQIIKFLSENSINEPQIGHTARQLNAQKLTGETTTDIMSNIYDLEGNNKEWTAQADYANSRVYRGGGFINVASNSGFDPASYRLSSFPTSTNCYFASRSVLCVK